MLYFNFRKMHFIVLFTLFSGLTPALIIHENVAFHKARSKWLSTFMIDLEPYENLLNRFSEDFGKAKTTDNSIKLFIIFFLSKFMGE